jgi:glutathione S-transferase
MRLYHLPGSRSTRVLWLLEEIGAPYELELLTGEDRKTPEHLERHPLGRVPVIEDEEGFVFESAGICLHLADLHPEAGLIPPLGTHERALVYQWTLFAKTELETSIIAARGLQDDAPERAEEAAARFHYAAAVVDRALEGKDYLVGGQFTVADVVCAGVLLYGARFGMTEGLENVGAYLERIDERPARRRATDIGVPAAF